MATLTTCRITDKVTEKVRVNSETIAVRVTTTEASTITVESSVDGETFAEIADYSASVNGTAELHLTDFVPGEFVKVKSTGAMTVCKILT